MTGVMDEIRKQSRSLAGPEADRLPVEVIERVMSFLDIYDLFSSSRVCEPWRAGCQNSAKKICEKVMDEQARREVLLLQDHDEEWVGALAAWYNGGVTSPQLLKKRRYLLARKTILLPKLINKPYYRVFSAIGSMMMTESRDGGLTFWPIRGASRTVFDAVDVSHPIIQAVYVEREEKLFFLRKEAQISYVTMPRAGLPSADQIVVFEGPATRFTLHRQWMAVVVGDRLITVGKLSANAEDNLILTDRKEIELESRVVNLSIWDETLMVVLASGLIVNYQIGGTGEPIPVSETERITAVQYGGVTVMPRCATLISNRNASELLAHWHMDRGQDYWIGSMFFGQNLETINPLAQRRLLSSEYVTYVTMRRRLLVFATNEGRLFLFNYRLPTNKSPSEAFLSDFYRLSDPVAVIRTDKQPIAKVDIGFERRKVYLFVLYQESRRMNTFVLRGGMDWANDGEAVIKGETPTVEVSEQGSLSSDSEDFED